MRKLSCSRSLWLLLIASIFQKMPSTICLQWPNRLHFKVVVWNMRRDVMLWRPIIKKGLPFSALPMPSQLYVLIGMRNAASSVAVLLCLHLREQRATRPLETCYRHHHFQTCYRQLLDQQCHSKWRALLVVTVGRPKSFAVRSLSNRKIFNSNLPSQWQHLRRPAASWLQSLDSQGLGRAINIPTSKRQVIAACEFAAQKPESVGYYYCRQKNHWGSTFWLCLSRNQPYVETKFLN